MKNSARNIAVVGAGSWGTALALLLGKKGFGVNLWGHRPEHIEAIRKDRQNNRYLAGFPFPECIYPTNDISEAVSGAPVVLMVVPSHGYRQVFKQVLQYAPGDTLFVSATKGIENDTLMTMTQVMEGVAGSTSEKLNSAVLSGPSFAREVAAEVPTAVTAGSRQQAPAAVLQQLLSTDYFRVYTSGDVIGLEISAALKNIIAIAAGICDGLEFGTNARAALITRGLAEITRFGVDRGAEKETFYGLSGLGDLVLTCTGELSRNRFVGIELGKGETLEQILANMSMVAEGVKTTRSVFDLVKKNNLEMPILEQVYRILYEKKNCRRAVRDLLSRDLKAE